MVHRAFTERLLVFHTFIAPVDTTLLRHGRRHPGDSREFQLQGAASEDFFALEAQRLKSEKEAAALAVAGFPLLHLPCLANPHAVLVRQTVSRQLAFLPSTAVEAYDRGRRTNVT